jgi:hypothetical protein
MSRPITRRSLQTYRRNMNRATSCCQANHSCPRLPPTLMCTGLNANITNTEPLPYRLIRGLIAAGRRLQCALNKSCELEVRSI